MLFNMYDLRGRGEITVEEFTKMIKYVLSCEGDNLNRLRTYFIPPCSLW